MFHLPLLTVSCTLRYLSLSNLHSSTRILENSQTCCWCVKFGCSSANQREKSGGEPSRAFYSYLQSVLRERKDWPVLIQTSPPCRDKSSEKEMMNVWLSKVIQNYTLLLSFIAPVNRPVYLLLSSSSHTTFNKHHNPYLCHSLIMFIALHAIAVYCAPHLNIMIFRFSLWD